MPRSLSETSDSTGFSISNTIVIQSQHERSMSESHTHEAAADNTGFAVSSHKHITCSTHDEVAMTNSRAKCSPPPRCHLYQCLEEVSGASSCGLLHTRSAVGCFPGAVRGRCVAKLTHAERLCAGKQCMTHPVTKQPRLSCSPLSFLNSSQC